MSIDYVKNDIEPNFLTGIPERYYQKFDHLCSIKSVPPVPVVKYRALGRATERLGRKGYGDSDQAIMEFIYKNTFATARQLYEYMTLYYKTPAVVDKEKFVDRLHQLVHDHILDSFTLRSTQDAMGEFKDALEIFCLDFGAKYILENFGEDPSSTYSWFSTVNNRSSKIVAKMLTQTEFYVATMRTIKHNRPELKPDDYVKNYISWPKFGMGTDTFELSGQLDFNYLTNKTRSLLMDVVYPNEEATYFRKRLKQTDELLHSKKWQRYFDLCLQPPKFIIIVADLQKQLQAIAMSLTNATKFESDEFLLIQAKDLATGFMDDPRGKFYQMRVVKQEDKPDQLQIGEAKLNWFGAGA